MSVISVSPTSNTTELVCNGKLLLSGEYFVLDGAKALAIPCKFGQRFTIIEESAEFDSQALLYWKAYTKLQHVWLEAHIDYTNWTLQNKESNEAKMLLNILKEAKKLNPEFLTKPQRIQITANLEFPRSWGLGSSSTLIQFIAQWANVNPYQLLEKTFGGSGYDIACAGSDTPILYSRNMYNPIVEKVKFYPTFRDKIYFVHLNEKMNSRNAIQYYKSIKGDKQVTVQKINALTDRFLQAKHINEFQQCMNEHEQLISETLSIDCVKDTVFNDFWGSVKSLGAWGGDFVMMTNPDKDHSYFIDYLNELGFTTVLRFDEMIFSK